MDAGVKALFNLSTVSGMGFPSLCSSQCSAEVLGTSLYAHLSTGRLAEPYTILKQLTSVLPGNLQKV